VVHSGPTGRRPIIVCCCSRLGQTVLCGHPANGSRDSLCCSLGGGAGSQLGRRVQCPWSVSFPLLSGHARFMAPRVRAADYGRVASKTYALIFAVSRNLPFMRQVRRASPTGRGNVGHELFGGLKPLILQYLSQLNAPPLVGHRYTGSRMSSATPIQILRIKADFSVVANLALRGTGSLSKRTQENLALNSCRSSECTETEPLFFSPLFRHKNHPNPHETVSTS